jgi:hypothetical protein
VDFGKKYKKREDYIFVSRFCLLIDSTIRILQPLESNHTIKYKQEAEKILKTQTLKNSEL